MLLVSPLSFYFLCFRYFPVNQFNCNFLHSISIFRTHSLTNQTREKCVDFLFRLTIIILTVVITFILSFFLEHFQRYHLRSNRNDVQPTFPQVQCPVPVPVPDQREVVLTRKSLNNNW